MKIGALSHEQARHYTDQGYLKLPRVFSPSEVKDLREFVTEEAKREQQVAHDLSNVAGKLYGLYDRSPEQMHRTVTHRNLVHPLESILGPNIVFVKNRHNHATINNHIGEPPEGLHRDILQATRGLVTAAVYLEDTDLHNGATRLIPGSHKWPNMGVPQADGGGTWMADHEEFAGLEDQALSVTVPAGGALLFNGLVFHGVGRNDSKSSRIAMTLGYRSVDELAWQADDNQVLVAGSYIYRGNDGRMR